MIVTKTALILLSTIAFGQGCKVEPSPQRARGLNSTMLPVHSTTIAEELLDLELGEEEQAEGKQLLAFVIDTSVTKFGKSPKNEPQEEKAGRFFTAVDEALIEHNFIFPPRGLIDLLRNALKPRSLSEDDYKMAGAHPANKRRLQQMKRNIRDGGVFYFVDCDLSAIIYVAAGQRLGLPITFVEVPGHNFVRWSSATLTKNWDSNDGASYSDADYYRKWGVTEVGRKHLGWLADMPRERILSYWLEMIGNWHNRQGRYPEALAAFRSAVSTNSHDLAAANSLAWFLATCPNSKLRNGKEAEAIAKSVTDAAPRANWIDTLAAACAERGNFSAAVETELKAKAAAGTDEWGVSGSDVLANFDDCIAAYRKEKSYREGVELGLIHDPKLLRPYD